MAEISLAVMQPLSRLTEAQKEAMRAAMFTSLDGVDETSKRAWRRFWNRVSKMEVGEIFWINTHSPRSGPFHRLHMAIEKAVFDAQERFTDFEQFRVWLKVGAGHVDWVAGPKGAVIPVPKSIAYSKLDEDGMREFHAAAMAFLREPHALKVLWPKLDAGRREQMMETVLGGFEA